MKTPSPKIDFKGPDKNKPNWGINFWPFSVVPGVLGLAGCREPIQRMHQALLAY